MSIFTIVVYPLSPLPSGIHHRHTRHHGVAQR
jgi:hypothetical protein